MNLIKCVFLSCDSNDCIADDKSTNRTMVSCGNAKRIGNLAMFPVECDCPEKKRKEAPNDFNAVH